MKKIFSLLCAMALVLSASAVTTKAQMKAAKAQLPAIEMSFNHNRLIPVKASSIKKAPAAVSNDQIVADFVEALFVDGELTDGTAIWEFDFFNGDDFSAYVMVPAIDDTHIAGTYPVGEGVVVVAAGDTTDIVSGSMTITYDVPSTSYNIVLSATCANGQTYTMTQLFGYYVDLLAFDYYSVMIYEAGYGALMGISSYDDCLIVLEDAPFEPTGDTINVVVPGVSSLEDATATQGWFEIYGGNDDYYVILDFMTEQVLGTYGPADFDYDYTAVYDANDVKIAVVNDSANSAVVYQSADTIIAEAFFMAKDGNYYNVVMKYYIPTPTEIINVTLEGEVDDVTYADYGVIDYEIENADYVLSLLLYFNGPGTYTLDDVVNMNSTQGSYLGDYNTMYIVNILDATFVVAADYSMTATLISADARQFNITYGAPTALKNVDAAVKASKVIKNGQLVIEKNGVLFNAQGAKL